jgi:hypothetical protein
MPDITPELRQRVLDTLDTALKDLRQLPAKRKPPRGYLGFQQAQNRLEQSRAAVEGFAERKSLVNELKRLDDAVSKIGGGGDVAPAVKDLRTALATLLKELGSA